MTAPEYFAATVEGDRAQLVNGAIVVNEPKPAHSDLQAEILVALRTWTQARPGRGLALLPTDVVMDQYNVYGPDVIWIAEKNRPADLRRRLPRVPDLCVEIRSPGTWRYDIGMKKSVYETGGLPELWLVDDISETVLVFRRSRPDARTFDVELELDGDEALTSPQLPGFALSVGQLFRR